jgi:hypothetical protein
MVGRCLVRNFSTTSRPALRAAASGGRPRAGNDTTVTQRPASPNAAGWRSAPGLSHLRQASDGAMDSRSLGVGTGREALSQKLRLHRRVRGSSFGNGLEVGALLPGYRASHRLTEPIERTSFPNDLESRHTYKRREAPQGLPHYRQLYTGTQAMLYSSVAVVGSPSYKVLLLMMMTGP